MPKDVPNFALLIGKPKPGSDSKGPSADQHAKDLGVDDTDHEDSAVKDLMSALKSNDVEMFKSALGDYLELCYPQLADSGADEESEDQEEPSSDAY